MIQRALNDTDWTFLSGDEQTRAGAPPRPQDLADAGSMASVASGGVLSVAAGAELLRDVIEVASAEDGVDLEKLSAKDLEAIVQLRMERSLLRLVDDEPDAPVVVA